MSSMARKLVKVAAALLLVALILKVVLAADDDADEALEGVDRID